MNWLSSAVGFLTLVVCIPKSISSLDDWDTDLDGLCIFDEIQPSEVPRTVVQYENEELRVARNSADLQRSRRRAELLYQPIRITPFFSNTTTVYPEVRKRLRGIVTAAIQKITRLLSVIPVKDPLLLERQGGCQTSWTNGPNHGKCAQIDSGYKGENCDGIVQIPDNHLKGLYTWNETYPHPVREHRRPGHGVRDADYILYVESHPDKCLDGRGKLIAYALHCQLDQNDRPIAGYVNFCPNLLESVNFDHQKFYLTAVHELFHALGFSSKMFRKFKECDRSDCTGTLGGVTRLIMPAVVRETQGHFGCPGEQDFGPPLAMTSGRPSSHWHPRYFQGSIMAPTIGQTRLTFLDRVTLALFEDTGWYKVNYSEADDFTWGKGRGCGFGHVNTCQRDTDYFCTGGGSGCHYTHVTKGQCDTNKDLQPCRIYLAAQKNNCSVPGISVSRYQLLRSGEEYTAYSRCFLSNLTLNGTDNFTSLPTGRCFQSRCIGVGELLVKTATSNWIFCPFGKKIYVPGYRGSLQCPVEGSVCTEADPTTTTTTVTSTARPTVTKPRHSPPTTSAPQTHYHDNTVRVAIVFSSLDLVVLTEKDLVRTFVEAVLVFVVDVTDITERRLRNVNVKPGSVQVQFDINPAESRQQGPLSEEIFRILVDCVERGNFTVDLPTLGTHVATTISKRTESTQPTDRSPSQFSAGGIAGVVLGAVALLVALVIGVFIINKYKLAPPVSVSPATSRCAAPRELSVVYTRAGDAPRHTIPQKKCFTDLKKYATSCDDSTS